MQRSRLPAHERPTGLEARHEDCTVSVGCVDQRVGQHPPLPRPHALETTHCAAARLAVHRRPASRTRLARLIVLCTERRVFAQGFLLLEGFGELAFEIVGLCRGALRPR
eukprot:scaffold13829_cov35-Tisochrysis_lutea.AAC.5